MGVGDRSLTFGERLSTMTSFFLFSLWDYSSSLLRQKKKRRNLAKGISRAFGMTLPISFPFLIVPVMREVRIVLSRLDSWAAFTTKGICNDSPTKTLISMAKLWW